MQVTVDENNGIYRIRINNPLPPVDFGFDGKNSNKEVKDFSLSLMEDASSIIIEKPLYLKEHVIGLGEKAFELDRRRAKYLLYNTDAGTYKKFQDPLYINIPFMITVNNNIAKGYFVNSASKVSFDIGFEDYNKIKIVIPERAVEVYVFDGPKIEDVIERFTNLTGKPYLPPYWSFGYMISRYSYFPQERIIELVDSLTSEGFKVTGVFLDIDYMDSYKIFTWSKDRFPDPEGFLKEMHKRGIKVITIIDHGIKVDQKYGIFLSGLGNYCETDKDEVFVGRLWAGPCVYPDFFKEETRNWWAKLVSEWILQGVDGIWLDMNEPTDFTQIAQIMDVLKNTPLKINEERSYYTFPEHVMHNFNGKKVYHNKIRNAYPYYEAMATYKGFIQANKEPFILSRSGYAGIQRFASVWTGDNTPSWDDLKLQLKLVLGLSISGVPYVGIDIGGFWGRNMPEIENSQELLLRYYQLALFFPLYRSHKSKDGIDTEPIFLSEYYKSRVRDTINVRYKFLPYLYMLAEESHRTGHPILRPLFYEFQEDENAYYVDDEYMVGRSILYSPILHPNTDRRLVYLPGEEWVEYWEGKVSGKGWIRSVNDMPIYIRKDSIIPLSDGDIIIYGNSKITYRNVMIESKGNRISFSKKFYINNLTLVGESNKIVIDGTELYGVERRGAMLQARVGKWVNEISF